MAFNQFEKDRGPIFCGDCGVSMGFRIDIDPGTVTLLCKSCYSMRTQEDPIVSQEGLGSTTFPESSNVIVRILDEHVGIGDV